MMKTNSTITAPAYTISWTTKRNCALSTRKMTERAPMVMTSDSAE
jgi:hypothetical protein